MSRIENELVEQDVANTLIEPIGQQQAEGVPPGGGDLLADLSTDRTDWRVEQDESYFADPLDLLDSAIDDQERDRLRLGDAEFERQFERQRSGQPEPDAVDKFIREQAARRNAAGPQAYQSPQPGKAATPEPTPGEVQQSMAVLDRAAQEYGVSQNRGVFASELAGLYNSTAHEAGMNAEALEKPFERAFVSSFDTYVTNRNNLSELPPIPDAAARNFTYDFVEGLGLDARSIPNLDHRTIANAVRFANLSIFATYEQSGGVTDVRRVNDPEICEGYVNAILRAMDRPPVSRGEAVAIADVYAKYVLSNVERVQRRQAETQQVGQAKGSGRRGRQRIPSGLSAGIRGEQAPRFTSNADIFSPGVVAAATTQRL
ncbi:MAG: hypothetical protein ACLP3K_11610 [Candidatus Acidiferrales bacterium]